MKIEAHRRQRQRHASWAAMHRVTAGHFPDGKLMAT
jgi:hypothetical protein